MTKKMFIAGALVVGVVGGVVAEKVAKRATIGVLYKKTNATTCTQIVAPGTNFQPALSNSIGGTQATIRSNGGTRYTLWEDANCQTTPVYLQ